MKGALDGAAQLVAPAALNSVALLLRLSSAAVSELTPRRCPLRAKMLRLRVRPCRSSELHPGHLKLEAKPARTTTRRLEYPASRQRDACLDPPSPIAPDFRAPGLWGTDHCKSWTRW